MSNNHVSECKLYRSYPPCITIFSVSPGEREKILFIGVLDTLDIVEMLCLAPKEKMAKTVYTFTVKDKKLIKR